MHTEGGREKGEKRRGKEKGEGDVPPRLARTTTCSMPRESSAEYTSCMTPAGVAKDSKLIERKACREGRSVNWVTVKWSAGVSTVHVGAVPASAPTAAAPPPPLLASAGAALGWNRTTEARPVSLPAVHNTWARARVRAALRWAWVGLGGPDTALPEPNASAPLPLPPPAPALTLLPTPPPPPPTPPSRLSPGPGNNSFWRTKACTGARTPHGPPFRCLHSLAHNASTHARDSLRSYAP
jgi:hypothetical protein